MSFQPGAVVNTQAFGNRPEGVEVPHLDVRAPSAQDTVYPVGKRWIDTVAGNEYSLTSFSSSNNLTTANWAFLGSSSGDLNSLTTDDLTIVTPTAGTILFHGTANQIVTTGANAPGAVTAALSSTLVAPGSITATTTVTAGTGITSTTGNIVATAGAVNAGTTMTAGTGITATTGNIVATAGAVNAGTTMTAGTGITATTGNIAATAGAVSAGTTVTAGTGITATTGAITATAGQVLAGGDTGGVATKTALTNTSDATIGAGAGSILMATGNPGTNAAWIKIYVGVTAYWIPVWTTNAP